MGAIHLGKNSGLNFRNSLVMNATIFPRLSFFATYLAVEQYFPRHPQAGVSKHTANHLK